MTALELEPLFVKALRLLHSRAKDSTEQLRQMLIDCLHPNSTSSGSGFEKQEKNTVLHSQSSLIKKASPKHPVEQSGRKISIKDAEDVIVTHKRKEYGDKRLVDVPDWLQDTSPAKRLKIDSPKPSRSPSPAIINKTDDGKKEVDEDSSFDGTDAAHIALEMGLACEVCRSFDVTTGNTLVECQDCHTLYHQDCHKPPISEQDINDPRVVWYCAKCTKNLKKIVSKTTKTSKTTVSLNPKETIVIPKPVKVEPALPQASIFKRSELKANNSGTTTPPLGGSNKPIGLAALAASLSGGKAPQNVKSSQVPLWKGASSSSSSSSSSSKSTPATSPGPSGSKTAAVASALADTKPCAFSALMASTRAALPGSGNNSSGNGGNGNATSTKGLHSASTTATAMKQSSSAVASSATSSTSSTSSSSGAKPSSSSSLMSADKRLQIMKKKAAAKRHEKRKLSSK